MKRASYSFLTLVVLAFCPMFPAWAVEVDWEQPPVCDPAEGGYSAVNLEQGFRACFMDGGITLVRQSGEEDLRLLFSTPAGFRSGPPLLLGDSIEYRGPDITISAAMKQASLNLAFILPGENENEAGREPVLVIKAPWRPEQRETRAALDILDGTGCGFTMKAEAVSDVDGSPVEMGFEVGQGKDGDWVIGLSLQPETVLSPVSAQIKITTCGPARTKADPQVDYKGREPLELNDASETAKEAFATLSISSITPDHGPLAGGEAITLNGSFNGGSGTLYFNGASLSYTSWQGNTISFNCPAGQGANIPVYVTNGNGTSNTVFFNYDPPVIATISPSNGPIAGNTLVTLAGDNFGTGSGGSLSFNGATVSTQSWTNTSITFKTPAGSGTDLPVFVSVGNQSSNTVLFTYYNVSSAYPMNGPTTGGELITVSGEGLGSGGTITFGTSTLPPLTWSNTQITFTSPQGEGADETVTIKVAGQTVFSGVFTYDPPVASVISMNHGPTGGGTPLTIDGQNFGTNLSLMGTVSLGDNSCDVVSWSHTSIMVTAPPGCGENKPVVVRRRGGSTTDPIMFSYDPPVVTGITPDHSSTYGQVFVTLTGTSLGHPPCSGSVKVGGTRYGSIRSWTDNQVIFLVPEGTGVNNPVVFTLEGRESPAGFFSYDPPFIDWINPPSIPAGTSGASMVVYGSSFGRAGDGGAVTLNGVPMESTYDQWDHNRVSCLIPSGEGANLPVVITVGGQVSNSALFSYQVPCETAPGSTGSEALLWNDPVTLSWPPNSQALGGYRIYRGSYPDLPALLTTDPDACLRGEETARTAPSFTGLSEVPGETQGYLYWYLVTGVNASGEGDSGDATAGPRQLDSRGSCE